ncbi:hypothetical protein ACFLY4_10005 [Chloroflexota bacterium]
MKISNYRSFPRWAFVILAIGSFWACGVYMGIQSVDGVSLAHLLRVIGFSIVGLLFAWGAIGTNRVTNPNTAIQDKDLGQ